MAFTREAFAFALIVVEALAMPVGEGLAWQRGASQGCANVLLGPALNVLVLGHDGASVVMAAGVDVGWPFPQANFAQQAGESCRGASARLPKHHCLRESSPSTHPRRGYTRGTLPMALLARTARQALAESRAVLPPSLRLPLQARIATVSHTLNPPAVPEALIRAGHHHIPATPASADERKVFTPHARSDVISSKLTPEIEALLPLLHSQPAHYITIHLHGRPYLVTKGDSIRLPFLMPDACPGDILRLNRATHLGSRDYTLKAPAPVKGTADHVKKVFYLDDRLFTCRARVLGIESEPLRVKEKTKRRQRHTKHVKSKLYFTVLKISELEVKSLEAYESAIGSSR